MNRILIYTLLVISCVVIRNKADAETGGLLWSTSPTGPWYNNTPNSWCDGSQPATINWRMDYNYGGPAGGFGANPYRYNVWLYRDGNLIYNSTFQGSSYWVSFYDYNEPLIAGTYDVRIKFELRKITGWETYSDHTWNHITMEVPECCPATKIITGTWTKPLQESGSYIVSSGTTTVPTGANVKLDATPGSYILLDNGFETQSGSVFVAQAYNGCSPGAPSIAVHDTNDKEPNYQEKNVSDTFSEDVQFILYPNPTNGEVTIEHPADTREILLFNLTGQLILRITPQEGTVTKIDLSSQPEGTYLLKTDTSPVMRLVKQ